MANVSSSNGLEKRPKLRFPGFDEPWEENELSHYLVENTERNRGLAFGKEDVLSVSGEYGVINQIAFQGRSFAGESVADYHVVETDDIVYTKSPLKANPYGIIKVNKGIPGIVSTLYAVYHPLNTVAPRFVDLYFANNLRLNKFLKPLVNIGAKHDMKVNNSFVLTGTVVFPSIGEQQKLVDFFAKLDRRIEAQRKIVEALKKYKRGLLNQVFSSKQSFWTKKRIGDFCSITMGQSPDSNSYNLDCIGVPLVQGNADITDGVTTPLRYTSQPTKVCKEGSILLSVRAPVGTVCIADREVCLGRGVCAINSENNAFVRQLFLYLEPSWKTIEQGGTFTAISRNDIENVEVIIPNDASEQKWIGEYLEQIDLRISQEARMLQSILSIRLGLMQQLFI